MRPLLYFVSALVIALLFIAGVAVNKATIAAHYLASLRERGGTAFVHSGRVNVDTAPPKSWTTRIASWLLERELRGKVIEIELPEGSDAVDAKQLQSFSDLSWLRVHSRRFGEHAFYDLPPLPRLTKLECTSMPLETGWLKSVHAPTLEELSVRDTSIGDDFLEVLPVFPQLKYVDVSHTRIGSKSFSALLRHSSMDTLIAEDISNINSASLAPVVNIGEVRVRDLRVAGREFNDEWMECFMSCESVARLTVNRVTLGPRSCEALKRNGTLRYLSISSVRDSHAHVLLSVAAHKTLEEVAISNIPIQDAELERLLRMPQLLRLRLVDAGITTDIEDRVRARLDEREYFRHSLVTVDLR